MSLLLNYSRKYEACVYHFVSCDVTCGNGANFTYTLSGDVAVMSHIIRSHISSK